MSTRKPNNNHDSSSSPDPRGSGHTTPVAKAFYGNNASGQARQHNGDVNNYTNNNFAYYSNESVNDRAELNKSLLEAAANGLKAARVNYLVGHGAQPDCVDEGGLTPLYHACWSGFEDTAEALLKCGANVNAPSAEQGTPLCVAVLKQRRSLVTALLDAGADTNAPGGLLGSALHAACFTGDMKLVATLLSREAQASSVRTVRWEDLVRLHNPKSTYRNGLFCECQPAFVAAWRGHVSVMEMLLQNGFEKTANCSSWMSKGRKDLTFESVDANQCRSGSTVAHLAASNGHGDFISLLARYAVDLDTQDSDDNSPLHIAAEGGHHLAVTALLQNKASPYVLNREGLTAIHVAIQRNQAHCVRILAKFGAHQLIRTHIPQPLTMAASLGHVQCVTALVDLGAVIDHQDERGQTALTCAVENGHVDCVRVLVDRKASLELRDQHGRAALATAATKSEDTILEVLIAAGADENIRSGSDQTPLMIATAVGSLACVKTLIENGVHIDAHYGSTDRKQTALCNAVLNGHAEIVSVLLKAGADGNICLLDGTPLLVYAARKGYMECVCALIEAGVKLNATDSKNLTALSSALAVGHRSIALHLIEAKASLDTRSEDGSTPLIQAARSGDEDTLRKLLEQSVDVNARRNDKTSAAAIAAANNHASCLKLLLDHGANFNLANVFGRTPIMHSVLVSNFDCLETLIAKIGRDKLTLDRRDNIGVTALFLASTEGVLKSVQALIDAGASLDIADDRTLTPLMRAIQKGHFDVASLLIESGADVNACTHDKETIMHAAAQSGNLDIWRRLAAKGAKFDTVSTAGKSTLAVAALNGHLPIVREFLKARPVYKSTYALHLAAQHGRVSIVRELYSAVPADRDGSILRGVREVAQKADQTDVLSPLDILQELRLLR